MSVLAVKPVSPFARIQPLNLMKEGMCLSSMKLFVKDAGVAPGFVQAVLHKAGILPRNRFLLKSAEFFKEKNMETFEPVIVAFVCNWCTYTAADLAGTSRLSYPTNIRLIRVMCTGMVDPQYVIKAFLEGADGVLISGCHPGDCHYINGNYKARRRIKLLKEILPRFGIEKERLRLTWIGASDGIEFAEIMTQLNDQIIEMGPSQTRLNKAI